MKFKIIKATPMGCGFCSPIPSVILEENTVIEFMYEITYFTGYKGENEVDCPRIEEMDTIKSYINRNAEFISELDAITITTESALHGEIYELNKEDNKLYLVGRTRGWA